MLPPRRVLNKEGVLSIASIMDDYSIGLANPMDSRHSEKFQRLKLTDRHQAQIFLPIVSRALESAAKTVKQKATIRKEEIGSILLEALRLQLNDYMEQTPEETKVAADAQLQDTIKSGKIPDFVGEEDYPGRNVTISAWVMTGIIKYFFDDVFDELARQTQQPRHGRM